MSFVVHRVTKSAARYTDAGGREKCGYCRFFVPPRSCGKVIGPVSPMGWCKHFSRQMVSQFGGGSTPVGGGPPGMTLALDFMQPGTLDPRITFTRASSATYTDASGVVQTAATNAPRWDYAGGVLRGLLIEEQRTNLILQSSAGVAPWIPYGNIVAQPTVTANNTTAPDGTATGTRMVFPAVSGASAVSLSFQNINTAAAVHAFSLWLKGGVGGEQIYINADLAGGSFSTSPRLTLTTQWQRFTLITSTLTAAAWTFAIGVDLRDGGQAATTAQTVYAWGAQVEQGAFPTSHIPTTSVSVTRAQDFNSMSTSPWLSALSNTWFAEFISFGTSGGSVYVVGGNTTGAQAALLVNNATYQLQWWDGIALATTNSMTLNAISKGASAFASGTAKLCLNGGPIVSGAANGVNLPTVGFLEPIPGASTNNGSGYMRRVQYWNRVLSDAELQQVTT